MSIEKLLSVIIPPCKPQYTGTKQMWDDVEIEMGLIFPEDYKNFINIYGPGDILGFFSIASPFGPANCTVMTELSMYRKYGYAIKEVFPIYPEKNGLLYWGGGEDGVSCWWLMRGSPHTWPIVLVGDSALEIQIYKMSMVDFITNLVSGRILPEIFREKSQINFTSDTIFSPWF